MSTPLCPPEIRSTEELKQLQRVMGAALMRPLTGDDKMQTKWSDGRNMNVVVDEFMKPNERMTAFARLEIYNRQYWFRLLDCLYEDYPGLRALLGDKRFHTLSRAYLAKYPSESFTLRNLGSRLEKFIQEEPKWTGAKQAMALDVARFEWAQILAFDEARLKPVVVDDLLGIKPDELYLRLQPYLVLLDLDYAVDVFFSAVRKDESGMRSESSNAKDTSAKVTLSKRVPLPKKQKTWLAVHRFDNLLYIIRLEKEAWLLLKAISEGKTVGEALSLALANADETLDWSAKIKGWFENWAALGWFC
jgi:hypothetical protein